MPVPSRADRIICLSTLMDETTLIHEAALRLLGTLDLERALGDAYEYLRAFVPLRAMALLWHDPRRRAAFALARVSSLHGVAAADRERPVFTLEKGGPLEFPRRTGGGGDVRTAQTDTPSVLGPSLGSALRFLWSLEGDDLSLLRVLLEVPPMERGELWMAASGRGVYTEAHVRLAESLAVPAGLAMGNALRYHEAVRGVCAAPWDPAGVSPAEDADDLEIIGANGGLRRVMDLVAQAAPIDVPVLLQGETGTGKEVVARAIHRASPRRDGPLVRVQCGAVPENLLESELFGHEKGAFTGATHRRRGRFERAAGGTLFFDEIGELSLDAQVKLLRVLDDHSFERVGGSETLRADVRVLAATHRDLAQAVDQGRFREDLWFRLDVFPIHLPPLRQRKEDIPVLARYFLRRKSRELGREAPELGAVAVEALLDYDWPGNVRELENVMERALILYPQGGLEFGRLLGASRLAPADVGSGSAPEASLDEVVAQHIRRVLSHTGGRVEGEHGAARILGIHPSTLRARMRKLGIAPASPVARR